MPVNITTLIHALAAPLFRASRNTRRLVALLLDVVVVGAAFYGVMALRYLGLPMPFIDSMGSFRASVRVGDVTIPNVSMGEPLKNECLHFLECVQKGTRCESDGRFGAGVVPIAACVQLLKQGGYTGPIAIEHEPNHFDPTDDCIAMHQMVQEWWR